MLPVLSILCIALLILTWPLLRRRWREHQRAQIRQKSFPAQWSALLRTYVPLYNRLPHTLREQLHGHIQVLLAEKEFHGAGGLTITDSMRLIVSSQAALLLLNRQATTFRGYTASSCTQLHLL